MRPDAIAALGNRQIRTPHLDALVRAGTVFRQATCANPICVPSRAEMLSGRTSFRNGFYATGARARDGAPTWAETAMAEAPPPPPIDWASTPMESSARVAIKRAAPRTGTGVVCLFSHWASVPPAL